MIATFPLAVVAVYLLSLPFATAVGDALATSGDDSPTTYLYYYSSMPELLTRKHSALDVPLTGLHAIAVGDRHPPKTVTGQHPAGVVEMGPSVSLRDIERQQRCLPDNDVTAPATRSPTSASSVVMAIQSVSFDAARGRVVLHSRRRNEDNTFSLVAARVCPEQRQAEGSEGGCTSDGTAVELEEAEVETLFDHAQIQPATYQIDSFAMHDGILYFILDVRDRIGGYSMRHTIELRRLRGWNRGSTASSSSRMSSSDDPDEQTDQRCAQLFSSTVTSESYFDVVDCSELLATISQETFQKYSRQRSFEGLLIIPSGNTVLDFYLEVQQVQYDSSDRNVTDVSIVLYHFRLNDKSAQTRQKNNIIQETVYVDTNSESRSKIPVAVPIYTAILDSTEYFRYVLYQRGGLSALRGLLCWSAIDRVMCGRLLPNGSVADVRMRLSPGLASTVCKGAGLFANVVTGVAVVQSGPPTDSKLAFYFGCVAETPGMGGAGLFVIGENESSGTVYSLRSNGSDIRAESMFISTSPTVCPVTSPRIVQQLVPPQHVIVTGNDSGCSTPAHALRAFPFVAVVVTLAAVVGL